jgi:hypothetical protein
MPWKLLKCVWVEIPASDNFNLLQEYRYSALDYVTIIENHLNSLKQCSNGYQYEVNIYNSTFPVTTPDM